MNSERLRGKVAVITGGGAGIGAATARVFCEQAAKVLLFDRDTDALQRTVGAIRSDVVGAELDAHTGDVANPDHCAAAIERAVRIFGKVDTLVNNAGIRVRMPLWQAGPAEWQRILDVNLLGAVYSYRAALPALRQSGKASVVNVSSVYAVTGRVDMGLYDATKAAMLALTRTIAFEEAAHGIRANVVCPGSTLTDFHVMRGRAGGRSEEDMRADVRTDSLLKRWATPEEIAYPIAWLASEEASFITGTQLIVDGGLSIM